MAEQLTKKFGELMHELHHKQGELEQLQQNCYAEQLSKQELLAKNESLDSEVNNLRAQLELTNKVLYKCEEGFKTARDSAVKHRLSTEASSKSADGIKEQSVRLHNENRTLKKQIEQLEKAMKEETFFRDSCTLKQTKAETTIESLINRMRSLEKEFREVERKSNESISVGKQSQRLIDNKDATIIQLKKKNEELTAQVVSLANENKALREIEKGKKPVEQHYVKEILREWQTSQNEMKLRIQNYEKESETLLHSLQSALDAQIRFEKMEAAATEKVKELEAKLEHSKKESTIRKGVGTDCATQTDPNSVIHIGCQATIPPAQVTNSATQSDFVDYETRTDVTLAAHRSNNQVEQNDPTHLSPSSFAANMKYSNSCVSELILRFQRERGKQDCGEARLPSSQPLDICEMPTQVSNDRLHIKDNN